MKPIAICFQIPKHSLERWGGLGLKIALLGMRESYT